MIKVLLVDDQNLVRQGVQALLDIAEDIEVIGEAKSGQEALELVPAGSSREQVLLSLGTPSTTNNQPDGSETFYYVSQKKARRFAFEKPRVVDQRVLAVYMNQSSEVERIANYGMKDGKVFDFVARVTPTGGRELSFISQLLRGAGNFNPFGR